MLTSCHIMPQVFASNNVLHYLHFWREVEEYKGIPVAQVIFIQMRAEKVRPPLIKFGCTDQVLLGHSLNPNPVSEACMRSHELLRMYEGG